MNRQLRPWHTVSALTLGLLLSIAPGASAQDVPLEDGSISRLLTRAYPDEYFYGIGDARNQYIREGVDTNNIPDGALAKVNQAYVWGLAYAEGSLFFGTVANGSLLAYGVYNTDPSIPPAPQDRFYNVSEYATSVYGQNQGLPPAYGDWRPPLMARHILKTGATIDLTDSLDDSAQALWLTTEGMRAVGAAPAARGGPPVVLMAGPPIDKSENGIAIFAFDARNGAFLGATELPEYLSIRRWALFGNDLYAAVHHRDGRGAVIRWNNRPSARRFPFVFSEVGRLDQPGADICVHDGRLFVTTWPVIGVSGFQMDQIDLIKFASSSTGLWMSPRIPRSGLTPLHSRGWSKVWSTLNYDPDALVALSTAGGALASHDGWLYFGTLNLPGIATVGYNMLYDMPSDPASMGTMMNNIWRATTIFRMRKFRSVPVLAGVPVRPGGEIELLYGEETYNVYDPKLGQWTPQPNRLGQTPRMGRSGFGNRNNTYAWSMQSQPDGLYVGTQKMKFASKIEDLRDDAWRGQGWGAELHRLAHASDQAFVPVDREGAGNVGNNGIRAMTTDGHTLFIGTANACNKFGDFYDNLPDGGWELRAILRE